MIELRKYQIDIVMQGTSILQQHGMMYLAMEVRTGKTITSLTIAEKYGAHSVLFVTKKKAISSIERDYNSISHTFNLDVINYDALHKLTPDDINDFDFIICDEAHCMGAFPLPSKRSLQMKSIVGSKPVIYLSGTPTPESWSQIYHQLWISDKSPYANYRNFYKWAKDYVDVRKKYLYNREINDYTDADMERIQGDTEHLFISFTQQQAGFTQLVDDEILYVEMSKSIYAFAAKLKRDSIVTGMHGDVVMADTAVKLMQKFHQIYSGTVIIDEPERMGKVLDFSKVDYIKEKFAGQKIAIFYKFIAERHALMYKFAGQIVETPEEFNATGPEKIYISQIQSGREGINLSAADAIIMYNIDFSAVSYFQARARLQSKERIKPSKVFWIFAKNGIEEKIYLRVKQKMDYTLCHFHEDFRKIF